MKATRRNTRPNAFFRYLIDQARAAVDLSPLHLIFAADVPAGAITAGRSRAVVAAVVGMISVVIGGLALARSRRSRSTD